MSDRMVLLAIYGNPVEAELVRAQLEGEGIRAVVMGATSGDVFAGMGVGMSNVQILVPEADLERAGDLLDTAEEEEVPGEDEDSTAIKGKSPRKRSSTQVRAPRATPLQGGTPPPESPPAESSDLPPEEEMPPEEDDEREERVLTWTADEVASRAFRSALLGFLTCGLLHFYAIWLLLKLPSSEGELSPGGFWKAIAAMVLAPLPGLLFAFFWLRAALKLLLPLFT
jgi:hypothetical protein